MKICLSLALAIVISPGYFLTAQQKTVLAPTVLTTGQVSMIGCLMREADFRALKNSGAGGVLGTGIGNSNEYVLVQARPVAATAGGTITPVAGRDFGLTGSLEKEMSRDVGRMIEVVGTIKEDSERLPQLTASLAHAVGDFCPASVRGTTTTPPR